MAPVKETTKETESKEKWRGLVSRLRGETSGKTRKPKAPSEKELEALLDEVQPVLARQPMLVETAVPITIVGDIHGQYADLLRMLENNGEPSEKNPYLFLGDYVDRGKMGTETMALLLAYKVLLPNSVWLLRGNHESAAITRIYGFYDEMNKRYSEKLWKRFTDVFNWLPVAGLVDKRILCMHGGLSPHLTALDQIRQLARPSEVPDKGIMCDLLWSDPNKQVSSGWAENTRGIAFTFAADVVKEFCRSQDLDLIVRAHQVVEAGYEFFAGRRLLTIFSAPNYCGEFDNSAAIMKISKDLECSFLIFRPDSGAQRPSPAAS